MGGIEAAGLPVGVVAGAADPETQLPFSETDDIAQLQQNDAGSNGKRGIVKADY